MERNCLSRHITLWRSLKAPYGPGDALAGAIRSRVYRAPPGDHGDSRIELVGPSAICDAGRYPSPIRKRALPGMMFNPLPNPTRTKRNRPPQLGALI
jgi:hypothetical protein